MSQSSYDRSMECLKAFDQRWTEWTLANGLRCLHVPLPDDDVRFHLTVILGVGSLHESHELSGVSHLLEHMMFRGSSRYPTFSALSEAFEDLGGEWNAATGHEYTEFYYGGTVRKMTDAMALFSDFMMAPTLNDLDTEKRIVLRELEGELNENGVLTDPDFHISAKIWPATAMAMPITGTEESIQGISMTQLKSWYETWYQPSNAVICVAGGRSLDVMQAMDQYFGSWVGVHPPKLQMAPNIATTFRGPVGFWIENSDHEYQLQLSFICEGTGSAKTPAYEMLSRILGDGFSSRFTKRIREQLGLVYDLNTGLHQYRDVGVFNITAGVMRQNLEAFVREIQEICREVCHSGFTGQEIERHRQRVFTDLEMTTAEPSAIAWRGCWGTLTNTDTKLSDSGAKCLDVNGQELQAIANEIFQPQNLCAIAFGPDEDHVDEEFKSLMASWTIV